jgi:hypothetical protein
MPATMRDRRSGVIETEARIAGSLLELWRTDNTSLHQAAQNTLGLQRRRARFEFTPIGLEPLGNQSAAPLTGPDVVGAVQSQLDLTQFQGELHVRALVFIERAHAPGLRRSTWSRSVTTATELVAPEENTGQAGQPFWVPVGRDTAYERRLLSAVAAMLEIDQ